MKRLGILCTTLILGACTLDETGLLPTCPAGSVARGGLCSPVPRTSNLQVSPEAIDFGGIALGASSTRNIRVENSGVEAQTVRVQTPDNSAFSIAVPGEALTLGPGDVWVVPVTYQPNTRDAVMSTLRIETCTGGCAVYVTLNGFGLESGPSVQCAPLNFPDVPPGECTFDVMICRNFGLDTVRITNAEVESDDGAIQLSGLRLPITLGSGDTDGIPLSFCPDQPGSSEAVVRVSTSDGAMTTALAQGEASGRVDCEVAYDRELDFGTVSTGTSQVLDITMRNRGRGTCYIIVGGLSPGATPPFQLDPNLERILGPGQTWSFPVRIIPSPVGFYFAELMFQNVGESPFDAVVELYVQVEDLGPGLEVTSAPSGPLNPMQGSQSVFWDDSDDDGFSQLMLPFPLTLFGRPQGSVWISTNGLISFAAEHAGDLNNSRLPDPNGPNQQISWWWDDLYPGQSVPPGVQWIVEGPPAQQVLRIQFIDIVRFGQDLDLHVSAEVRLYESDSRVEVQYGEVSIGVTGENFSATAGWEGPAGRQGADILGCSPNCTSANWPTFTTWTYRDAP